MIPCQGLGTWARDGLLLVVGDEADRVLFNGERRLRPRTRVLGSGSMGITLPITIVLSGLLCSAGSGSWVLPPTAEPLVRSFVERDGGRLGDVILGARIEEHRVVLVGTDRSGETVMQLPFVHPSQAPEGAVEVGGLAVVPAKDPATASLTRAVIERLKSHPLTLPWREIGGGAQAKIEAQRARDEAAQRALAEARYARAVDDLERARAKVAGLPSPLSTGVWIEVALLQRQLGDLAGSSATLERLKDLAPVDALAAKLLADTSLDVTTGISAFVGPDICKAVTLVGLLAALDRPSDALSAAQLILERDPACGRAWERALHLRLDERQKPEALKLARAIIERFPEDDELLQLAATALSANQVYREAAPILEGVARRNPDQTGVIRVLLSTVLRDPEFRAEKTQEYERRHGEESDDPLVTFLLGVVKHYANDFEASSELLRRVEKEMDHQGRLHIYLAMNDFNQGGVDAAMERLNRIAKRPIPDPDIFYCRAEILRDTNRKQAIIDLKRYMAPTGVNILANPEKERRVDQMIELLETCEREGTPECEGPWEHPRFRHHTESKVVGKGTRAPPLHWVLVTLVVVVGGIVGWRRRRAS